MLELRAFRFVTLFLVPSRFAPYFPVASAFAACILLASRFATKLHLRTSSAAIATLTRRPLQHTSIVLFLWGSATVCKRPAHAGRRKWAEMQGLPPSQRSRSRTPVPGRVGAPCPNRPPQKRSTPVRNPLKGIPRHGSSRSRSAPNASSTVCSLRSKRRKQS